ncbi:MAG: alpha/beta fold hydrolase [Calditrichia bacterium]|nr:alpha/beta fold hydrolase [Calditrichia bacterium]
MKLYSQKIGKGDPFIILHGLFGSSDNWLNIAKQLADNYTIHLLDSRNHGKSPHTNEFGYDNMAMDVREYIQDHNLKNIILMGHSMGGKVAMKIALEYPMRVKKLIVADIAPKKYPIVHNYIIDALLSMHPDNLNSREHADLQLSQTIKSSTLRKFLLKNLYRGENNTYKWRINLKAICDNLESLGAQITSSQGFEEDALFLKGELSDYITVEDENEIFTLFSKAVIKSIPRATHWLHAENPDFLLKEVCNFLETNT